MFFSPAHFVRENDQDVSGRNGKENTVFHYCESSEGTTEATTNEDDTPSTSASLSNSHRLVFRTRTDSRKCLRR